MSEYRIEKVRHHVGVALANGRFVEGDIFLQPFARFRPGPERPLDVLNDDAPFLPVVLDTGELRLLQKSQLTMVATALPAEDDAAETGLAGMHVEFTLTDDTTLNGSVFPELPADRPRLIDFLNATTMRFVPVFGSERLLLVARAHIVSARPVS